MAGYKKEKAEKMKNKKMDWEKLIKKRYLYFVFFFLTGLCWFSAFIIGETDFVSYDWMFSAFLVLCGITFLTLILAIITPPYFFSIKMFNLQS